MSTNKKSVIKKGIETKEYVLSKPVSVSVKGEPKILPKGDKIRLTKEGAIAFLAKSRISQEEYLKNNKSI